MNFIETNQVTAYESYDETVDRTRHQKGMGIEQIAKECGVGIGTVYSLI
jgi:transposase